MKMGAAELRGQNHGQAPGADGGAATVGEEEILTTDFTDFTDGGSCSQEDDDVQTDPG